MALSSTYRWIVYAIALFATIVAVQWTNSRDDEPSQTMSARAGPPAQEATPAAKSSTRGPEISLDKMTRGRHEEAKDDPFGAKSWEAIAQAEIRRNSPPPPPQPPQAPPLPFAYMGKLVEDGKTVVFLTKQDRNLIVRNGETVEGAYRVDEIREDRMVLTYLPLQMKQELAFGRTTN